MNQAAQSSPDYQIKHRQLSYLVQRLEQIHPDNDQYSAGFKMAKDALQTGDIYNAANYLQVISPDMTAKSHQQMTI